MSQANRNWNNRPQTAQPYISNADRMRELSKPDKNTEFDMIKFLDTYKRSIDFYNSYGLDKKGKQGQSQASEQSKATKEGKTTFWDY